MTTPPPPARTGLRDQDGHARPRPRDGLAVLTARAVVFGTRRLGRNATSVPGVVAEAMAPGVARRLAADLDGVCLVSGTNGKTSTARFLAHVLEDAGYTVIANRSGANLAQGAASALVAAAGADGRVQARGAMAVLEVDEAVLPALAEQLAPDVLVLTNLFRDQLDRFGETDHLVRLWAAMLRTLPAATSVVYCADDPRIAALVRDRPGCVGYSLARPATTSEAEGITPDVPGCPVCTAPLEYAWTAVGHLGDYACARCGFRRPEPSLEVASTGGGLDGQTLAFTGPSGAAGDGSAPASPVEVGFPGLGNAYNAAAAVAAARALGADPVRAIASLATASVPFARFEFLNIGDRRVVLSLLKNAATVGELTRVLADTVVDTLLFVLSDNFQDGRDVSWYWDADPAAMIRGRPYVISGRRRADWELRLRYELLADPAADLPGFLGLVADPVEGLDRVLEATRPGGTCFVVAQYTALLALRAALVERGRATAMPR